ncbi:MAG: T9SS C-terminal target domain-containing protein [Ignavibacteriae bacterium]|nr:MAG: T9SS C-terminal target domain-containing protein [Ignavibacteriota bacterium]
MKLKYLIIISAAVCSLFINNVQSQVSKDSLQVILEYLGTDSVKFPQNPFGPVSDLKLEIKQDAFTTFTLLNDSGEVVCEMISDTLKAGKYIVKWNISVLKSGIYFYRLKYSDFAETKKIMIVK